MKAIERQVLHSEDASGQANAKARPLSTPLAKFGAKELALNEKYPAPLKYLHSPIPFICSAA